MGRNSGPSHPRKPARNRAATDFERSGAAHYLIVRITDCDFGENQPTESGRPRSEHTGYW